MIQRYNNTFSNHFRPEPKAHAFKLFFLLFLGLLSNNLASQIIFSETFSSYPDGTTAGPNWIAIGTDCDDASPNEGLGISAFGVYNGRFTANDSEGAPCCPAGGGGRQNFVVVGPLSIEDYCSVFISIQTTFDPNHDCDNYFEAPWGGCLGTNPPDDLLDMIFVEYSFDNGPWIPHYSYCTWDPDPQPHNHDMQIDVFPADTFRLRVSLANNADDEFMYLDYVTLTGILPPATYFNPIGPFCDGGPIFNMPNVSVNGYPGSWDIGPFFDPTGLAGTSTTAIFTPDPDQCALPDTIEIEVLAPIQPDIDPFGPFCSNDPAFPLQLIANGYDGYWTGPGTDGMSFYPDQANIGTNILTYHSIHCGETVDVEVEVGNAGPPILEEAELCSSDPPIDLTDLQDPNFSSGTWSGPGVSGTSFDPDGQNGAVVITFTSSEACVEPLTTTITVNPADQLTLGTTTLCSSAQQFNLSQLADPAHTSGTWSGPGVNNGFFDPSGQNGQVTLHFAPNEPCVQAANTTITVTFSEIPALGSESICEDSQPFDLAQLTDPNFPNGTWDGPGVNANMFNPNGFNGSITLSFLPTANCVETATTIVTVNPSAIPQLETATLCETDSPLSLSEIADPAFTTGTWSGPGVSGNDFDPSGQNGLVALSFSPSANCASVATTSITVNSQPSVESFVADCDSTAQTYIVNLSLVSGTQPYSIDGNTVNGNSYTSMSIPSGMGYSFTLDDQAGCGPVTVSGTITCSCVATASQLSQTLCPGEGITVNGTAFNEANPTGTVLFPNGNFLGCDSTVTVSLTYYAVAVGQFQQTICQQESIILNGTVFDASNPAGAVILPNASYHGCDSIVNVALSFWPAANGQLQQTLCTDGSLTLNGTVFDEANPTGTVVLPNASQHGCDSTVTVNLTFTNAVGSNFSQTLCAGESISINGQMFDEADPMGSVLFPNGSYLGCDSVVNVALSFWPAANGQLQQTLCTGNSLTVNGTVFDETNPSGTVVISNGSQHGCDSTIMVNLTFTNVVGSNFAQTLCPGENISINGQTFDEANPTGSVLFPNGSYLHCDSVVNVALSFWPAANGQLQQTLCTGGSLTINGTVFNEANPSGTVVLPNAGQHGCDSTIVVDLSFANVVGSNFAQTFCPGESISINGQTFDETSPMGSVIFPNGSYLGCDSIINVALSFWPSANGQLQQTLCTGGSLTINGTVFDEANPSGTVILPNTGQHGCDSTVTVSLSFNNAVISNLNQTLCSDESLSINGQTFDQANPSGSVVFPNGSYLGCDSVLNVALSFWPSANGQLQQTLCTGGSLTINGTVFNEANPTGTVVIPNASQYGCDSTVTVSLSYNNAVISNLNQTLCPDENLSINGQTFDQSNPTGSVFFPNGSYLGCDSTVMVSLSYFQEPILAIDSMMQPGQVLLVNNNVYSEQVPTGVELVENGSWQGCDSTIFVNLSYPPPAPLAMLSAYGPTCVGENDGSIVVDSIIGASPLYIFSLGDQHQTAVGFPIVFDSLAPGNYTLTLFNLLGQSTTFDIQVPSAPNLSLNIGPDASIHLGESIQLSAITNFQPSSYTWSPAEYLDCENCPSPVSSPLQGITYTLTATSSNGCTVSDELTIFVELADEVYVPNAFSPNGDGINDVFTVFAGSSVSKIKSLMVFDRWGDVLFVNHDFSPNDFQYGWDGTNRGKEMDSAVFVWFAIVEFKNGSTKVLEGGVTLVR